MWVVPERMKDGRAGKHLVFEICEATAAAYLDQAVLVRGKDDAYEDALAKWRSSARTRSKNFAPCSKSSIIGMSRYFPIS